MQWHLHYIHAICCQYVQDISFRSSRFHSLDFSVIQREIGMKQIVSFKRNLDDTKCFTPISLSLTEKFQRSVLQRIQFWTGELGINLSLCHKKARPLRSPSLSTMEAFWVIAAQDQIINHGGFSLGFSFWDLHSSHLILIIMRHRSLYIGHVTFIPILLISMVKNGILPILHSLDSTNGSFVHPIWSFFNVPMAGGKQYF